MAANLTQGSPQQPDPNDPKYAHVFQSSNLLSGRYDPQTHTLTLVFGNGSTYEYASVPDEVWFRLVSATSPGRYFHASVRPNYIGRQVA